ncbi:MAG: hypothetical protein IPN76_20035 [Saprospiraceae bacterium]|nr:hypothetical protein [Saprospiraceae bacterium]
MLCYNCRIELNKDNQSKEHIPAQAFFAGYGNDFKINRITVPACKRCNIGYSKTDQELRDAIGVTNDRNEHSREYTRKSVSSILKKKGRNKLYSDEKGSIIAVSFAYNDFKKTVIKDFKGVFHHKFGYPLPRGWKIEIVSGFEEKSRPQRAASSIYAHLNSSNWSISGHTDIFRFKIEICTPDANGFINYTTEIGNAISVIGVQEYNNKLSFVIIAAKHRHLNSKKSKEKRRKKKAIRKQVMNNKARKALRNKIKGRKKK